MNSLDPRVNRLPDQIAPNTSPKVPLDQFGTYEVFVQARTGKPFQHEGIVHAPNLEMAFLLAKETFTRRFTCVSIYVVETRLIFVSKLTEGDEDAYNYIKETKTEAQKESFEIFHLNKRGKQHVHAGTVMAGDHDEAIWIAQHELKTDQQVFNIWAVRTKDIRFTSEEEQDLWLTLPEKKFRDAAAYKGGDKLKSFLEKSNKS